MISRVRLLKPPTVTELRSGSTRLTSPPARGSPAGACGACAKAMAGTSTIINRTQVSTRLSARDISRIALIGPLLYRPWPGLGIPLPADIGRHRHAAGQENPHTLFHGQIGKERLLRGKHHDVAQVQVIGRNVDRDQRLGALAAIDRELFGE